MIGDNLKRLREKAGISQGELGEKLGGISQPMVSQMERGTKGIASELLPRLIKILNCTYEDLLGTDKNTA